MFSAIFRGIAGLIWLTLLLRKRPFARSRASSLSLPRRPTPRWRSPRVPREAWKLLDDVEPPTREEIELYVPEPYRDLGPEWIFTRGKVLTFSETRKTRMVGSVGGFDVEREFEEEYSVYYGVYGYYDHRRRLQTFAMPPTENDSVVRPGRSFIICFDRRTPRAHHLFRPVRLSHPMKRYETG
jgi:hypothetical protein